jgi:hypothetical protein
MRSAICPIGYRMPASWNMVLPSVGGYKSISSFLVDLSREMSEIGIRHLPFVLSGSYCPV